MEQQAVDKGDIHFFELAFLEVDIQQAKKREVVVELKNFVIPNTELIPEEVRDKIKKWSDYIDYWAVDWGFQNDTFMNGWVTYRTRRDRTLSLKSDPHTYEKPGKYTIVVKVVDIFGIDTSQTFEVEVKYGGITMPRESLEAIIEPRVLIWARESMGINIDEVAKRLKVNEDTLNKWELGQKKPTLIQLEKLAKIYKRPFAAFFLPEPPKESPLPKDFRTLPSDKKNPFSLDTRLAIRRAQRLQSLAMELAKSLDRETITRIGKDNLSDDPEIVAIRIRDQLEVDVQTQFDWKNENKAFDEWEKTVENRGILVFQMGMPLEETRGFSLPKDKFPVIVLNLRDSINGRIFSLFHEYAHLLLNDGAICNMKEINNSSDVEKFCNHFAGAILTPKDALLNHQLIRSMGYSSEWSDETLKKLAKRFKVSQEVILRRLAIFGLASGDFYKRKREEWEVKTEEMPQKKTVYRRINVPKKCIRENGIPFVSLVLDAQRQKEITYSDVADYLAIRLKHLPKIEEILQARFN